MAHFNDFGFGIVSNSDVSLLKESIKYIVETFPNEKLFLVEIGTYDGYTCIALNKELQNIHHTTNYEYFGVDLKENRLEKIKQHKIPNIKLFLSRSEESFMLAPDNLHWVLIDGCHCVNHVMLDFLNYGYKVKKGGLIIFHDISPLGQNKLDYQGHGPKNHTDFGTATLSAFKKLDIFNRKDWKLYKQDYDKTLNWGGIAIFQKV